MIYIIFALIGDLVGLLFKTKRFYDKIIFHYKGILGILTIIILNFFQTILSLISYLNGITEINKIYKIILCSGIIHLVIVTIVIINKK